MVMIVLRGQEIIDIASPILVVFMLALGVVPIVPVLATCVRGVDITIAICALCGPIVIL